jgi:hypothetical protein
MQLTSSSAAINHGFAILTCDLSQLTSAKALLTAPQVH